jgi:3-phytase
MKYVLPAMILLSMNAAHAADLPVISAKLATAPLHNYEDAPATPDADDPAIWVNQSNPRKSLIIGTAKDAGLLVYSTSGLLVQAIRPVNAPQILPQDPATPAGINLAAGNPCSDSESGETFGRFNNVDIAYDVRLGTGAKAQRADIAVVSDRGCDRIRFFKINASNAAAPLSEITAADAPRVFPTRYDQPSALQPSGAVEGWIVNPVDDQNTVYGLTVEQNSSGNDVFVTQRERGTVRQLRIVPKANGTLTYELKRTFIFDTSYALHDAAGAAYAWTPCREATTEDPQAEGLEFDSINKTLFVAFETIGLYRIKLATNTPETVFVGADQLIEPVKSFGQPYWATPDDDEFQCEYNAEGTPAEDVIVAAGSDVNAGTNIDADFEGLSIVASLPGHTLMLASSQGDSSFHLYRIGTNNKHNINHLGAFLIDGVAETDGVHYVPAPIGAGYPLGTLVVQNGDAPAPADESDINGYEYDGSTQFKYVSFADALQALLGQ